MLRKLDIRPERLPLREPFRISRGLKTHAEVVVVELQLGEAVGRGECTPYARYGETTDSVVAQLRPLVERIAAGAAPRSLVDSLPAGAARNALDCAVWDLEARSGRGSVAERIGRPRPGVAPSAITISLDEPEAMAAAAAKVAGAPLLKVKLDADAPAARLEAVATAAPGARLIVDPNESWTAEVLQDMAPVIARLPVALLEQPLPAGEDEALRGVSYPAPVCADEAVHTADDLPGLVGKYQMVNIKLDKTGGLTEALRLLRAARQAEFGVMCGCMVASSLSIVPALHIAAQADVVDLDGPWWLVEDRPGGVRVEGGLMHPPAEGFWGEAAPVAATAGAGWR